jgi:hypothetical protein
MNRIFGTMFLDEYGRVLLQFLEKYQYFGIFGDMVWAIYLTR